MTGPSPSCSPAFFSPCSIWRLRHRRRGIAVGDGDELWPVLLQLALEHLGGEYAAPFGLDRRNLGTAAPGDLDLEVAEAAEDRHEHPVTRLDQRGERGLDSGARGAVDKQRRAVLGLEHAAVE